MKKEEVIKKSSEFDEIIKNNKFVKNNNYIIYYRDNDTKCKFGISVGKKIGNAVTRNYYKRVIRNICDKSKNLYSNKKDYIIIMRKGLELLNFDDACLSMNDLLKKINN